MTALLRRACLLLALCLLLPAAGGPEQARTTGGAAAWQSTGSMTVGRGWVLVAGGVNSLGEAPAPASAELYGPP